MDSYVTGTAIRQLREAKHMTQAELAEKLAVSAKAISKWETAHGLPDISLLEPLAAALGVSVLELMQGEPVVNRNRSANLLRSKLYVCPLCGNVLHATGQAVVSCCGITLPPLDISESGVHQRASTPSRDSMSFWPSSRDIQNRPVVRQSAAPESGERTLTLSK